MQQHQRFQIRQEPMPTHMHEELLLQGMLVGARYGTGVMMQGPHDILYAEIKVVTPAGTHKIVMMQEQKSMWAASKDGTMNSTHLHLNS